MSTHPDPSNGIQDRRLRVVSGSDSDGAEVAATLDGATIRVVLPPAPVPWRLQVLALTLVDLLGRLFPRLDVVCSPDALAHPDLPPGATSLRERLLLAARNGGHVALEPNIGAAVTVTLGAQPVTQDEGYQLCADGGGWVSYNGSQPSQLPGGEWGGDLPIGALIAACRAAGQATHHVLHDGQTGAAVPAAVYADALRYEAHETPVEIEVPAHQTPKLDAILVGAGSIGGAAIYAMANVPTLTGSLVVADPQRLESKNPDRALLATADAATAEDLKVDVAQRALEHNSNLEVTAWPATLEQWVASRPATNALPLVLAAVDSRDARRNIQDCLPLDLINAACSPHEVHLSVHRTGDGPCVCCLHMEEVFDTAAVRVRIIKGSTGLNERFIQQYLASETPMPPPMLRSIEQFRALPSGALASYEGCTLEELRVGALLYGATPVSTSSGTVAVAAPYMTALAGFLLTGEALKAATPELSAFRLGPHGLAVKYAENPLAGAHRAMLTNPPRWPGSECICGSTRRARILAQRYGLE